MLCLSIWSNLYYSSVYSRRIKNTKMSAYNKPKKNENNIQGYKKIKVTYNERNKIMGTSIKTRLL